MERKYTFVLRKRVYESHNEIFEERNIRVTKVFRPGSILPHQRKCKWHLSKAPLASQSCKCGEITVVTGAVPSSRLQCPLKKHCSWWPPLLLLSRSVLEPASGLTFCSKWESRSHLRIHGPAKATNIMLTLDPKLRSTKEDQMYCSGCPKTMHFLCASFLLTPTWHCAVSSSSKEHSSFMWANTKEILAPFNLNAN